MSLPTWCIPWRIQDAVGPISVAILVAGEASGDDRPSKSSITVHRNQSSSFIEINQHRSSKSTSIIHRNQPASFIEINQHRSSKSIMHRLSLRGGPRVGTWRRLLAFQRRTIWTARSCTTAAATSGASMAPLRPMTVEGLVSWDDWSF